MEKLSILFVPLLLNLLCSISTDSSEFSNFQKNLLGSGYELITHVNNTFSPLEAPTINILSVAHSGTSVNEKILNFIALKSFPFPKIRGGKQKLKVFLFAKISEFQLHLTFSENSLLTVSPSEFNALHEYFPAEKRVTRCSTRLWLDLMIFVVLFVFKGRPY